MAIEVEDKSEERPGTYLHTDHMIGMTLVRLGSVGNILQIVFMRDQQAMATIRARMYMDDKVFNSEDKRFFTGLQHKDPITPELWWDKCLARITTIIASAPPLPHGEQVSREDHFVNGTTDDFMKLMMSRPWAHIDAVKSAASTADAIAKSKTRN